MQNAKCKMHNYFAMILWEAGLKPLIGGSIKDCFIGGVVSDYLMGNAPAVLDRIE